MNTKYIIIVLAEPNSVFSEIIAKYFVKKYKLKKKVIIVGNVNLLKAQLKKLKYNLKLNEIFDISQAAKNN